MAGADSEEPVGPGCAGASQLRRTTGGRGSKAGRACTRGAAGTRGANIRSPTTRSPPAVWVAPETAANKWGARKPKKQKKAAHGTGDTGIPLEVETASRTCRIPQACWQAGRFAAERHARAQNASCRRGSLGCHGGNGRKHNPGCEEMKPFARWASGVPARTTPAEPGRLIDQLSHPGQHQRVRQCRPRSHSRPPTPSR